MTTASLRGSRRCKSKGITAPQAADAERNLELRVIDGAIEDIGFAPHTNHEARQLLSTLATTVWPVVRDGESWRVEQTDMAGAHTARYVRSSADIIERRVEAVTALRGPKGLETHGADAVRPEGVSVFEFDALANSTPTRSRLNQRSKR